VRTPIRLGSTVLAAALGLWGIGCSSSPAPEPAGPPPSTPPDRDTGSIGFVSGSDDSVAAIPGSPEAMYRFRFKQVDPASERFTFQDRELSFYFKPAPSALHFQVENRQDRPVWIEWDRSTFYPPVGTSGKVAHSTTRWEERFRVQSPTQIAGLQRYGDYVLPLDYLIDPAGSDEQLHRPLFREDSSAPQYEGKEFGVDLVLRIEDRFRTYSFRFRVDSVLPR
jgi:hypothetical protein